LRSSKAATRSLDAGFPKKDLPIVSIKQNAIPFYLSGKIAKNPPRLFVSASLAQNGFGMQGWTEGGGKRVASIQNTDGFFFAETMILHGYLFGDEYGWSGSGKIALCRIGKTGRGRSSFRPAKEQL
jgi:hypothetical protein